MTESDSISARDWAKSHTRYPQYRCTQAKSARCASGLEPIFSKSWDRRPAPRTAAILGDPVINRSISRAFDEHLPATRAEGVLEFADGSWDVVGIHIAQTRIASDQGRS
jgi:hypothetical protein